jgi:uncharacterized protein YaaQ
MKMVMAVIARDEAEGVLQTLIAAGFAATFTKSRGGVLRQAQQMLFIAVEAEDVERVLSIIREHCHSQVHVEPSASQEDSLLSSVPSVTAQLGGAVAIVWDLDRFEIY